jgi:hypothetical protein
MHKLQVHSSFNIIRYGSDLLRNNWSIDRDGFADVLQNTFDVTVPLSQYRLHWKYDTFSRTFQGKIPIRFFIVRNSINTVTDQFDSLREWRFADQRFNRFNQFCPYFARVNYCVDIIQYIIGAVRYHGCFDIVPCYTGLLRNDYNAVTDFNRTKVSGIFRISRGRTKHLLSNNYDNERFR